MTLAASADRFPLHTQAGNISAHSTTTDFATFGAIHINNTDLQKAIAFWTTVAGMKLHHATSNMASFGTATKILVVVHQTATLPFAEGLSGLYHFAIHAPNKAAFAAIVQRLIKNNYPFSPTDHTMSKSVYLRDPDGIMVEFALETPERFKRVIAQNGLWIEDADGVIHSASDTLDISSVLQELDNIEPKELLHPDTGIGHIHFYVSHLDKANTFYQQIGFTSFNYLPQYLYADVGAESAYKHRIAMNMWHGRNKPVALPDHAGLKYYTLVFHSQEKMEHVIQNLDGVKKQADGFWVTDPTGNMILLTHE